MKTHNEVKSVPDPQTVISTLQELLKESYGLFLLTHNYHWNVEGQNFVSLHQLFEQQYTELFTAIDEIAERIRALDAYALPSHYGEIYENMVKLLQPLKIKNKTEAAKEMVANLLSLHERVVASAKKVKELADDADDEESEDIAIARIQVHQKAIWMLRSIIK